MSKEKTRTFVFITNVPSGIDDDKLKEALRDNANEVMGVCTLPGEGYAMALFGSKPAALAACSNFDAPGMEPPLRLRAIKQESKSKVEDVFKLTVTIEGEEVDKRTLVPSRGYEDVTKGNSVPRWCSYTKRGEDCPDGVACRFIHKKEHQVTEKRKRDDGRAEHAIIAAPCNITLSDIPGQFRAPSEIVQLSPDDVRALLSDEASSKIVENLEKAANKLNAKDGLFVRLDVRGGAPVDVPFSSATRLGELKALAPIPDNGIPTPLERDEYFATVLHSCNSMLRSSASNGAKMLVESPAVRQKLEAASGSIALRVAPWRRVDDLFGEVRIFIRNKAVFCVIQRHDAVLSMKCLDELITEEETKASETVENFAHEIDSWLLANVELPDDLTCCMNVMMPKNGSGEKPWITSVKDYASVAQECTIFPSLTPELRCTPLWRRVKYARVPHFSRELLESLK